MQHPGFNSAELPAQISLFQGLDQSRKFHWGPVHWAVLNVSEGIAVSEERRPDKVPPPINSNWNQWPGMQHRLTCAHDLLMPKRIAWPNESPTSGI